MLYEDGKIYIKYKRKLKGGKKQEELFKKEPALVQLHPKMENVIRVHFKGKAPSWMKDFAAENRFIFSEVNGRDGQGFSLTVSDEKKYIICPFVKGQIMEWFEYIGDDSLEEFQDRLLENLEIVEKNLKHYAQEFYQYGFYHRAEEINGKFSSLALSEELKDPDNLDEMDPKERENWESLINSLIMERDYPIELDEDTADDEIVIDIDEDTADDVVIQVDEDTTDDVVIQVDEDTTDDVVIQVDDNATADDVVIAIDEETAADDVVIAIDEETATDDVVIAIDEDTTDDVVIEVDDNATTDDAAIEEEPTDDVVSNEEKSATVVQVTPKVATRNSKKDGVIAGQMLLF